MKIKPLRLIDARLSVNVARDAVCVGCVEP